MCELKHMTQIQIADKILSLENEDFNNGTNKNCYILRDLYRELTRRIAIKDY